MTRNAAANPMEILARNSSSPFFLPNKAWAPPAMDPERPEALPDCIKIVVIRPMQISTSNIIRMVFSKPWFLLFHMMPFRGIASFLCRLPKSHIYFSITISTCKDLQQAAYFDRVRSLQDPSIKGCFTKVLFDTHQLVVLGHTVCAGWCSSFDLPGIESHR